MPAVASSRTPPALAVGPVPGLAAGLMPGLAAGPVGQGPLVDEDGLQAEQALLKRLRESGLL